MYSNPLDLPDEIINYITEYLSIVDRNIAKNVCKQFNDAICIKLEDFNNILAKRIDQHTNSNIGFNLINLIKESSGYIQIGGNTINQCLHNQFLESSDIDIYITYDPVENDICDDISEKSFWNRTYGVTYGATNAEPYCTNDSINDTNILSINDEAMQYLEDLKNGIDPIHKNNDTVQYLEDDVESADEEDLENNNSDSSDSGGFDDYDSNEAKQISPQAQIMMQKYPKLCFDLIKNNTNLKIDHQTEHDDAVENYMIKGYHINLYDDVDEKINPRESFIKVQLILIPIKYDKDEIYDFTFSRNRYDGHNVYSKSKTDVINKSGIMNEWNNIYEKAVYSRGCTRHRVCEHMLLRANKYIQRGYIINNLKERMQEIDKGIRECILRNYYDTYTKIIQTRDTEFNDWMYNLFSSHGCICMGTRTIEIVCEDKDNNQKFMINNKGNPKMIDIEKNN